MDYPSRAPTMNLQHSRTELGRADPLKHIFRALFEVLPPGARGHVVATIGEFLGTMLFVTLAFSGVEVGGASSNQDQGEGVSTTPPGASPSQLLYASLAVGFSLVVCAWTFFRISGGLFNPVVSLGMALIGAITWARCLFLVIAQTSATIIAAYIVNALFNGGLGVAVGLGAGTSPAQGVVIEMLLTGQLVFVIFMLAAEEHAGTHLAPVGIGLSVFISQLIGLFYTGGAVNPARALAPCILNRDFPYYHWIYWVGPISGTVVAVLIYKLVKALEYETAHDDDGHEKFLLKQQIQRQSSMAPLEHVASDRHTPAAPPTKKPIPPRESSVMPASQSASAAIPSASVLAPVPAPISVPKPTIVQEVPSASVLAPIPVSTPAPVVYPAPSSVAPAQAKKEEVAALPECYAD